LHRSGSDYEVDLVDGEHGVSPGQACVFYDAAEGQARVLGGGFIRCAMPAGEGLPALDRSMVAADLRG
jgi:tRNA-specific 2-thiouridylase